jgi:hypothetical protein
MPGMENLAPERQETSSGFFITERLAGLLLNALHGRQFLLPHSLGKLLPGLQIGVACLGGDGETGRHRHADARHLGQVGSLSAQ